MHHRGKTPPRNANNSPVKSFNSDHGFFYVHSASYDCVLFSFLSIIFTLQRQPTKILVIFVMFVEGKGFCGVKWKEMFPLLMVYWKKKKSHETITLRVFKTFWFIVDEVEEMGSRILRYSMILQKIKKPLKLQDHVAVQNSNLFGAFNLPALEILSRLKVLTSCLN